MQPCKAFARQANAWRVSFFYKTAYFNFKLRRKAQRERRLIQTDFSSPRHGPADRFDHSV
jgi:hypothetical protein